MLKKSVIISLLSCVALLTTTECTAQLELKDLKFDYKNVSVTFDPLLKKLEKPEKFYSTTNNTFKYNYPVEIENASGGMFYRGRVYCAYAKKPTEADVSVISNFDGLQSCTFKSDETVNVSIPGSYNTTKGYIRYYTLVYPVTMTIYYQGKYLKTIDFFNAAAPLQFRLTKNLVDPAAPYDAPFTGGLDIANYETSGKVNKAAEKFAYFEAVKRVDEVIKNYIGSYDYDFLLGPVAVKKKKSADYADLNAAADMMEDGIKAFKKNDMAGRDSLINKALEKFTQLYASAEARINPLAKDVLNYDILVCYAVLGNIAKADEYLAKHMTSEVQAAENITGTYISYFIQKLKIRNKLKADEKIHL